MTPEPPTPGSDPADPDALASSIAQGWFADLPPGRLDYAGVPLGHALRRSVMLIVGRALRRQAFPEHWARDQALLEELDRLGIQRQPRVRGWRARGRRGLQRAGQMAGQARAALASRRGGAPLALLRDAPRLDPLQAALAAAGFRVQRFGGALVPLSPRARPGERPEALAARARALLRESLHDRGLPVADPELRALETDALLGMARIRRLHGLLGALRPRVVVLHDDTAPDGLETALVCRARGIPCVSIQHGLDCERFFLDQVYAGLKCVWGPERRDRLLAQGVPPERIQVTGSLAYDHQAPTQPAAPDPNWLWFTRPHLPDKCLLPGRCVHEGDTILGWLLEALRARPEVELLIKPHPGDYAALYAHRVRQAGLEDRVRVVDDPPEACLAQAALVFSEDSTTVVDTLRHGRPLIHTHASATPPAVPVAEGGVGGRAEGARALGSAVTALEGGGTLPAGTDREPRRRFLQVHVGPMDGSTAQRLVELAVRRSQVP